MNDNIGIVVIGRNEGKRLQSCFDSLNQIAYRKVYVDSGSSDNSVEIAKSNSLEIIELDPRKPFSAARARNEGVAK